MFCPNAAVPTAL